MPNRVRQLMEQQGKNVSDLMRASGLSWPTCDEAFKVDDWPTEGVKWGTVVAIAKALGVNPEYLISENDNG